MRRDGDQPGPRTWRELALLLGITPERFAAEAAADALLEEIDRRKRRPSITIREAEDAPRLVVEFDPRDRVIEMTQYWEDGEAPALILSPGELAAAMWFVLDQMGVRP